MRWVRTLLLGALASFGVVIAAASVVLFPYLRDDRALDWVVRVVALDWRDFGYATAVMRLQYEIDHRQIGQYVTDDDCTLSRESDELRVSCEWHVQLEIPFTERRVPLSFHSHAWVDSSGGLH